MLLYSRVTHETPIRKILDLRNTHEKKFWTQERSRRKNFTPTKYPWRIPEDMMAQQHQTHPTHDGMWPTEFSVLLTANW